MIQQKSFQPQYQGEQEFCTMVLRSICAKLGKDPADVREFPFKKESRSQFASDCLWASCWLSKDREDCKRMSMNRSFPRTQKFNTVCAATSANIHRTQRCIQHAGIAGLENISLVKNYVAE